jgi:nickel-dependent lactate racemase
MQVGTMIVPIAYGRGELTIDLPSEQTRVIKPSPRDRLPDERRALREALDAPIGHTPLRSLPLAGSRISVVFTDITRPTPNDRLIPWLLEYLLDAGADRDSITLLNSTGTHRPNTREELEVMLTRPVVERFRVINHECEKSEDLVQFGQTKTGAKALINRALVDADIRIITGFIEPHFFAGFSGGPKGVMPGVAGLETVMSNHGAHHISDPNAAFGITEGNPIWEEMRDIALRVGDSFLINVTLNEERGITGVFAGDLLKAHRAGTEFVRSTAMQPVDQLFDIVITSNSGYPLDMNLYQGVKGMSAGARIVKPGGLIIIACECSEGVPTDSPFDRLLRETTSPEEILALLMQPGFQRAEQWQAQIQSLISKRARILLYSNLSPKIVRAAHLTPCEDVSTVVAEELARIGASMRIAVLPQGPLTIPYLEAPVS